MSYDIPLSTFLSEDPLRFGAGVESYAYVQNAPADLTDPEGLCPWEVRQRPLKGFKRNVWPFVHRYFYNRNTGQSLGLSTSASALVALISPTPVPGKWERKEKPNGNSRDNKTQDVPDGSCDCVGKRVQNPGQPPSYCITPTPGLPKSSQCFNCQTWVDQVLDDCK